jgi:hypothetical protein
MWIELVSQVKKFHLLSTFRPIITNILKLNVLNITVEYNNDSKSGLGN